MTQLSVTNPTYVAAADVCTIVKATALSIREAQRASAELETKGYLLPGPMPDRWTLCASREAAEALILAALGDAA